MFTSVCDEDTVPRSFLLWLGRAVEDLTPSALLEPVQLVDVGSVSPVQMQQQGPTLLCTSHFKGSPAPWDTNRGITPHDTG